MMRSPYSQAAVGPTADPGRPHGQRAVPAPPLKAGDDLQSTTASFLRVIERLEDLVEEETAALRSGRHAELKDFNYRKGHGLLEFSRVAGAVGLRAVDDPVLAPRLASLRSKLETNQRVLKMHLEAVQEIAGDLAAAIREADSDGTYSQAYGREGIRQ